MRVKLTNSFRPSTCVELHAESPAEKQGNIIVVVNRKNEIQSGLYFIVVDVRQTIELHPIPLQVNDCTGRR